MSILNKEKYNTYTVYVKGAEWVVTSDQFCDTIVNKDDFIVEITISLQSLKDLNLLKNGNIETGIYRAKYHQQKDKTFKPTWITWINPNTKTPNFHIQTSFGKLELENY